MNRIVLFEEKSLYRAPYTVRGFEFGTGERSACIIGNLRGNEIQQIYICSQLVKAMKRLEEQGRIHHGHSILIVPAANPYSVNSKERFWPTDKTDINRMFPGYDQGETTQRIAAGIFDKIKDYRYGIQFSSFYMPGKFMPHVRMMETGYEDVELAKQFGLPYVVRRKVRPYDTTTLNYNWQIWDTKAFSLFSTATTEIDPKSANDAVHSVLRFLSKQGIIDYNTHDGYLSTVISDSELLSVRTKSAGIFENLMEVGSEVYAGQLLARILDPLEGEVLEELRAPTDSIVFFAHNEPLTYANTAVLKLIATNE